LRGVSLDVATRIPESGGVPSVDGFYAWWVERGALADVPPRSHPDEPLLDLLYVGISPARSSSLQDIRGRLLSNHIGGNTGSSTFRFVLASLLMETLNLQPRKTVKKVVLTQGDNARLRDWQRANLKLTWCERSNPWEIEGEVIATMKPPLNAAGNNVHPFYPVVKASRSAFRLAAIPTE
jgi:hypothetical protein